MQSVALQISWERREYSKHISPLVTMGVDQGISPLEGGHERHET